MKRSFSPLVFAGLVAVASLGTVGCNSQFEVKYNVSNTAPAAEAKTRLETFMKEELGRLSKGDGADLTIIKAWCTLELAHLLEVEKARGKAYLEGFAAAKGDPATIEKPLFADSGYFISATMEGEMSATVTEAAGKDKDKDENKARFEVKFTSRADGKSYDQGKEEVVMVQENGAWRIAEVEFSDGMTLTKMLKRPKYMELPAEGAK
ncbi:hypothetical protein [Verrucomicrobium sp. BvORR034]|uniref:hypothetical protein n=1 Tax=Verrucomicrobium sp. BvORR034 TaxID=1396418 RepID=UPI0006798E86|nr:hypothetical protein [Verrucomicrobium sp. BvORR034]